MTPARVATANACSARSETSAALRCCPPSGARCKRAAGTSRRGATSSSAHPRLRLGAALRRRALHRLCPGGYALAEVSPPPTALAPAAPIAQTQTAAKLAAVHVAPHVTPAEAGQKHGVFQWRRRELNPGPQGIETNFIHVRSRWLPPPTGVRGFGHDLASVFLGDRTRDALGHPALVMTPFRYQNYLTVGRHSSVFQAARAIALSFAIIRPV
jgi:hypothetical protein